MVLKYTLVLVVIILITELSSIPVSNKEILMEITAVTMSVDPNATEEYTPELNLRLDCNKLCQQRRRLWELLLEANK